MKKFLILFILFLFSFCIFSIPASARTVRKDRPVRLVNPHRYVQRYTHYRMGRGYTRRCDGSCHRQEDKKKHLYTYKPVRSMPRYASGASGVRPRKNTVKTLRVYKYNDFKRPAPVTYTFSPIRTY